MFRIVMIKLGEEVVLITDMVLDLKRNVYSPPQPGPLDVQFRLITIHSMHCKGILPESV
jgi:hypothetical protein